MAKRAMALIFVLILSLNTFAASVSENDGSAFITKAEFDSLKNTFQSQIDSYNAGIDNKIDSAIASYIAGITVTTKEDRQVICYTADGILSSRGSSDIDWAEGDMLISGKLQSTIAGASAHQYQGIVNVTLVAATRPTDGSGDFTEALVSAPQYKAADTAEWYGLCTTTQNLFNEAITYTTSGWQGEQFSLGIKLSFEDVDLTSMSNKDIGNGANGNLVQIREFRDTGNNNNTQTFTAYSAKLSRNINTTKYKNIIITKNSITYKRFSNNDEIRDFRNDSDSTGHTSTCDCTGSIGTSSAKGHYIGADLKPYYSNWSSVVTPVSTATRYVSPAIKPYFGFVTTLTNYNQLYTKTYDSYITTMKTYDASLSTLKDKDNKEHLALYAGCPICYVEKDSEVTLPIEFDDKTKNYDVWIRMGSFKNTAEVTADNNCITYDKVKYKTGTGNTAAEQGTTSKSIKIKNGEAKLVFTVTENNYIFIKWSIAGNGAAGGGLFKPAQKVSISKTS